jgi:hypothetical protein
MEQSCRIDKYRNHTFVKTHIPARDYGTGSPISMSSRETRTLGFSEVTTFVVAKNGECIQSGTDKKSYREILLNQRNYLALSPEMHELYGEQNRQMSGHPIDISIKCSWL